MKAILLVAAAAFLSACAATGPQTSWGKANVTKVEYGTDVGECTGLAAQASAGNGAKTAGGISGENSSAPSGGQGDAAKSAGNSGTGSAPSGAAFPTGGGAYRDSAPADVVNRAATQQRAQELASQRARAETYRGCLLERGYREFQLTDEQRTHLGTLKHGSKEYHEYLYSLGADPKVLESQAARPVK